MNSTKAAELMEIIKFLPNEQLDLLTALGKAIKSDVGGSPPTRGCSIVIRKKATKELSNSRISG